SAPRAPSPWGPVPKTRNCIRPEHRRPAAGRQPNTRTLRFDRACFAHQVPPCLSGEVGMKHLFAVGRLAALVAACAGRSDGATRAAADKGSAAGTAREGAVDASDGSTNPDISDPVDGGTATIPPMEHPALAVEPLRQRVWALADPA